MLYHNPKISENSAVAIHCPTLHLLENRLPPIKLGTNIIACAKIIGITPDAFNFNGKN